MQTENTRLAYTKDLLARCSREVWQIPEDRLLQSLTETNQALDRLSPPDININQLTQDWRRSFLGPTKSTAEELSYQLFASHFWLLHLSDLQNEQDGQS